MIAILKFTIKKIIKKMRVLYILLIDKAQIKKKYYYQKNELII